MDWLEIFINAFQELVNQLAYFLPRLIAALLIWWIGKYLLHLLVEIVRKADVKKSKAGKQLISFLSIIVVPVGKIILILIILDFLGIGTTLIGALFNALSFAIAIALGLAFGRALEGEAKSLVSTIKKYWQK